MTGDARPERRRGRLARVLQLATLFFLLKGIAWLVIGWLAWRSVS